MVPIRTNLVPILIRIRTLISLEIHLETILISNIILILVVDLVKTEAEEISKVILEDVVDVALAEDTYSVRFAIRLVMMQAFATSDLLFLPILKAMVVPVTMEIMVLKVTMGHHQMYGCRALLKSNLLVSPLDHLSHLSLEITGLKLLKLLSLAMNQPVPTLFLKIGTLNLELLTMSHQMQII